MHLSILTPEDGEGGGELDNFEKSLTNFTPIAKNFVCVCVRAAVCMCVRVHVCVCVVCGNWV